MTTLESALLSYLFNALWQVPLLFLAGWLTARMLRSAGPAAQHRVWVATVLLQCVLPVASLLPFDWLSNLLPWSNPAAVAPSGSISVVIGPASAVGVFHLPTALLLAVEFLYGLSTAFVFARFLWRTHALSELRHGAAEVPFNPPTALSLQRYSTRFAEHGVTLAASSEVSGPVTLGIRHKLILLPAAMADSLDSEDLETILAHEFAHIERQDFLKNLSYEFLSLPIRVHPIFWLTREHLIESREMVCDQIAAALTGRNVYAQSLLRLASLIATGTPVRAPHAIGIFDANAFERRVMKLTQPQYELQGIKRFAVLAACVAFGAATCGSALALRTNVAAASTASEAAAASASPGPAKVSAAVMAGQVINKVQPHYPEEAKKEKIQGAVLLKAIISKDGTIENLQVVSGPKELLASALDAVRQWTYKPYLLNDDLVEVETTITVTYSLGQ
jgi:TonB family protein